MFANSIDGLSNLETGISSQLGQFAETSRKYSGAIKDMVIMKCQQWTFDVYTHINTLSYPV